MPDRAPVVQIDDGPVPSYSDLQLKPLNVEEGRTRFHEADGVLAPHIMVWRNNLTALSQRRNLFFVACRHQVYVWEPAGPRQTLGSKPIMIITPLMKDPNAHGYISPEFPHAINHIIVDDLGHDEVLLLATDSGNVCGYHVETIFSEISRHRANGQRTPILYQHTDPFFCESVGASAWGLAVHKYARMIAVSANTSVVTVFAFALAKPRSKKDDWSDSPPEMIEDGQNYQQNWLSIDKHDQFEQLQKLLPNNHRSRNVRLSYKGHYTNIPNVAFLNSDLDSNGMWMISVDIDNRLIVWAVWDSLVPYREFDFSHGQPLPDVLGSGERGWNVLALDPRSFRPYNRYTQACGGKPYLRKSLNQPVLDITNIMQRIWDSSIIYLFPPLSREVEEDRNELMSFMDLFDSESSIGSSNNHDVINQESTEDVCQDIGHDSATSDRRVGDDHSSQALGDASAGRREPSDEDLSDEEPLNEEASEDEEDEDSLYPWAIRWQDRLDVLSSLSEASDHDFETAIENDNTESSPVIEHTSGSSQVPQDLTQHGFLDFPILHFSETDIRLLGGPLCQPTTVVCGAPLRQSFTRTAYTLDTFDRFNMVKYLPEDGIVVAATQKGRAAIISLGAVTGGDVSTFRVNWMVPLAGQEQYGDRPLMPLLGMAVSPIQGFEHTADVHDVPYNVKSQDDIRFHYRFYEKGEADWCGNASSWGDSEQSSDEDDKLDDDTSWTSSPTDAECYGAANWNYQPSEPWRGANPSRRYRLLLTYVDHTVLSYEFWYEWSEAALNNYTNTRGRYPDNGCDDFLFL